MPTPKDKFRGVVLESMRSGVLPQRTFTKAVVRSLRLRKMRHVEHWTTDSADVEALIGQDSPPISDLDAANIVTSETAEEKNLFGEHHLITIDLDVDHVYIPSTTPGHGHLLVNHPIAWEKYSRLLLLLLELGVLEEGYVDATLRRGYSAVRVPWIMKEPDENKEGGVDHGSGPSF